MKTSETQMSYVLMRNVFIVGFMGAGKTSLARRLARRLGVSSVDMDTYIERREGKSISQIFEEAGEAGFRTCETEVLRDLAYQDPQLISCGGGVVLIPENRDVLKDAGFVVYLKVSADEARSRIRDLSSRPLFCDIVSARRSNNERQALYEAVADVRVDTAGKTTAKVADEVQRCLEHKGVVCQQQK